MVGIEEAAEDHRRTVTALRRPAHLGLDRGIGYAEENEVHRTLDIVESGEATPPADRVVAGVHQRDLYVGHATRHL